MAGAAILLALGGQTAWLGFQATNVGQTARSNEEFVQVARQGALDLTNISSDSITQDVQRILDSSTGALLTDFQERSQSFAGFIQQAQSHSEATIREAGLESRSGDEAKVLVVLTVDASALGGANDNPQRTLRMRVTVQKVSGNQMKLANVEIVP
ncbi:hypothetical protein A5761_10040 [Mycolicibacterium setense]|nr:hypothetical protein A5761_10040 [Mycolicibacterium setense]